MEQMTKPTLADATVVEPTSGDGATAQPAKTISGLGVTAAIAAAGAAAATVVASNPGLVDKVDDIITLPGAPTRPNLPGGHRGDPVTAVEAARFLTQATFGPTDGDVAVVQAIGTGSWLYEQLYMPVWGLHQTYLDARLAILRQTDPGAQLSANNFYETFWMQAATATDQLRQRVKFALSEIFVVSLNDGAVDTRGVGAYYDMLGANAFGNYRTLLEQVSLHPMMGRYLTHLANQREDLNTGRRPDENFAREVMQLMSIGLYRLNQDGTLQTDGSGAPIPTYTPTDISELAKVFTGFSWYHPTPTNQTFFGNNRNADASVRPMIPYNQYHSFSSKQFLGVTIPATAPAAANAAADLQIALDTIFNHPNVGPFIGRQLIQRLVTSNPSTAYVARVAAAFNNNGHGVRGDMRAVITAVMMDGEARQFSWAASHPSYGKLREPIVRLANWMRSFGAQSKSGYWNTGSTSANTSLGQSPMTAPSVFNFYRPGYVPPNTQVGAAGITAPEFQGVDEVTVAGYLNFMQTWIGWTLTSGGDIYAGYFGETQLARDPAALAERMNAMLCCGHMSAGLRQRVEAAVVSVNIPMANGSNQAQIDAALLNRARLAVFLTMASPDYLVQR